MSPVCARARRHLPAEVEQVASAVNIPTLVGSGVTPENIAQFSRHAQGLIVGSYAKKDGHWANACDSKRLDRLVMALQNATSHQGQCP